MVDFVINGNPIPAPRPRVPRRGKPYYTEPYLSYKENLKNKLLVIASGKEKPIYKKYKPLKVEINFYMPIPTSLSKKKRLEAIDTYHVKKPDLDNLVKSILDGMNDIIFHDDGQVASLEVRKLLSDNPRTEVFVYELKDEKTTF